jgi:hypothetical protein
MESGFSMIQRMLEVVQYHKGQMVLHCYRNLWLMIGLTEWGQKGQEDQSSISWHHVAIGNIVM